MVDTIAKAELLGQEKVFTPSEAENEQKPHRLKSVALRMKSALHKGFSARDVLETISEQQRAEAEFIEQNVLPLQEKKRLAALRATAHYFWEQKAIFGMIAVYPALEVVKNFYNLDIPEIPLELFKHGTTAAVGAMMVGENGSTGSKIMKKSAMAAGITAGVAGLEKVTGMQGSIIAAVDEPLYFGAKLTTEKAIHTAKNLKTKAMSKKIAQVKTAV